MYLELNLLQIFWKIANFENLITPVTKTNFEKKERDFSFILNISNLGNKLSPQEQEKRKILFNSVIVECDLINLLVSFIVWASRVWDFSSPILNCFLDLGHFTQCK